MGGLKRTPKKLDPTGIGVEQRDEWSQSSGWSPRFRDLSNPKSWVLKSTFTQRYGFDPVTGTVINPTLVPTKWSSKVVYPDDMDLTALEPPGAETTVLRAKEAEEQSANVEGSTIDSVRRTSILKDSSLGANANVTERKKTLNFGDTGNENQGCSEEVQFASTPSGHAFRDYRTPPPVLDETLQAIEQWHNWAKGKAAKYAGEAIMPDWPREAPTEYQEIWKKSEKPEEVNKLRDLLEPKLSEVAELQIAMVDDDISDDDDVNKDLAGGQQKLFKELHALRVIADDMATLHRNAIEFLKSNFLHMRSDKMPAISPVDVEQLYINLQEFRRAVKRKYGELLKGWEMEIKTPPDESDDLRHVSFRLVETFKRRKITVIELMRDFMRYLANSVIPRIIHWRKVDLGLAKGLYPSSKSNHSVAESVVAGSMVSGGSYKSLIESLINKTSNREALTSRNGQRSTTEHMPAHDPRQAPGTVAENSNCSPVIKDAEACLLNKRAELKVVQSQLHAKSPRLKWQTVQKLKNQRKHLQSDITKLDTWLKSDAKVDDPEITKMFSPTSNSTRFPTPKKTGPKDRLSNDLPNRWAKQDSKLETLPANLSSNEVVEMQKQHEQQKGGEQPVSVPQYFGGQNTLALSLNLHGRAPAAQHVAGGGGGDPNDPDDPDNRGRRNNRRDGYRDLRDQHNDHNSGPPRPPPHPHGNGGGPGRDGGDPRRNQRGNGPNHRGHGGDPSPPSSHHSDSDDNSGSSRARRNRTYVDLDTLVTALNQQYKGDSELLEGFENAQEMEDFYRSLPNPWHVLPKTSGKKSEILKNISLILPESKSFTGNRKNGSYFPWRILVIEAVHRQPLSISDKIQQLDRVVKKEGNPVMQSIFSASTFTPEAYRRIIESLEGQYGGDMRAYVYLRDQMFKGSRLDLKDLNSVSLLRAKIEKFLEHVKAHRIQHLGDSVTILEFVLSNMFTEAQVYKFRKDCVAQKYVNTNSLQAVSEWLRMEENLLQWAARNHNQHLIVGSSRQGQKASAHKAIAADDSSCDEEPDTRQALITKDARRLVKKPDKKSTFLATNEQEQEAAPNTGGDFSGNESLETLSDRCDHELDESGDDDPSWCFAAVGLQLPTCSFCKKGRHFLHKCEEFIKLDPKKRLKQVQDMGRCINCMSPKHKTRQCTSKFKCQTCKRPHHTLLHFPGIPQKKPE